jgi:lipoprotein-releasing system permease protein
MAMIVVLSAFNGFENLLIGLYHHQDPDIRVIKKAGKFFELENSTQKKIEGLDGVAGVLEVIKDKAAIQYGDGQMVVEIKGVDPEMVKIGRIDSLVKKGLAVLEIEKEPRTLFSVGIQQALNVNLKNQFDYFKILYPKRKKITKLGTSKIFNTLAILPSGVIYQDENQVVIPLKEARILMDKPTGNSQLDVYLKQGFESEEVEEKIQEIIGNDYEAQNEIEQHADLFKILKIEKLFVFLALGFIILISSFNLFVSCSMLVINKKVDFFTLSALGMEPDSLSAIVKSIGALISGLGLVLGLTLGLGICLLQLWSGLVPLGMSSTAIQAYPIHLDYLDFVWVIIWVLVVSAFALWVPARMAKRKMVQANWI